MDLQNGKNENYWKMTLSKYPPTFFGLCNNAIEASKKIVAQWLRRSMMKDLSELAEAAANGYHCSIDFVIQMNGVRQVNPNDETQPEFRQALLHAVKAGVEVVCHGCHVEADRIWIFTLALLDKCRGEGIPVRVSPANAAFHFVVDVNVLFAWLVKAEKDLSQHAPIFRGF